MKLRSKWVAATIVVFFLSVSAVLALTFDVLTSVPDFNGLKTSIDIPIHLADGTKAKRAFGPRTRGWVPYGAISKDLLHAVVSSEDTAFYSHEGIDIHEIKEALRKDLQEKRLARGASTITQQVLKNAYLGSQKTLLRKIKEIFWAGKLEKALTKSEILAFYVNMAEWGPGIYGIGDASAHYFSVPPSALTAKQSAFLAMLLPSPRRYHSYFYRKPLTKWAAGRVNRILHVMFSMNFLDDASYEVARNESLWGQPEIADDLPGAPSDPGLIGESSDDFFETGTQSPGVVPSPASPSEGISIEEP